MTRAPAMLIDLLKQPERHRVDHEGYQVDVPFQI